MAQLNRRWAHTRRHSQHHTYIVQLTYSDEWAESITAKIHHTQNHWTTSVLLHFSTSSLIKIVEARHRSFQCSNSHRTAVLCSRLNHRLQPLWRKPLPENRILDRCVSGRATYFLKIIVINVESRRSSLVWNYLVCWLLLQYFAYVSFGVHGR